MKLWNPLSSRGQCTLGVGIQRPRGVRPLATPYRGWAIVDTGANASFIQEQLARDLGLEEVTPEVIENPGHAEPVHTWSTFATLTLYGDEGTSIEIHRVLVAAPGMMKPAVILGTDAFERGKLEIDFERMVWSLTLSG